MASLVPRPRHEKGPRGNPRASLLLLRANRSSSVIHAHAAHAAARHSRSFLLWMFGDRRLGGDDQTRDRRGVLEGRADDLCRIDNAERDEIPIFAGLRIIAVVIFLGFEQLADDYGAVRAGVVNDLARRRLNRLRTMST